MFRHIKRVIDWLSRWASLVVAVIALAFSIYAIVTENLHYSELTQPHAQHEEAYDKLARLDARLERARVDT
jgi:hypothetical protein